LRRVLYERTLVVMSILFCLGLALVSGFMWFQSSKVSQRTALHEARQLADALAEFRTLYTAKVVSRAKAYGMEITHDYENKPGAIPLPATLSMELGRSIGAHETGAQSFLYSPHPFPWREGTGGLRDPFRQAAWAALNEHPDRPYYSFESVEGVSTLRFATADLMREACVGCHNTHEDTPKDDWKVGDVRGVLEVAIPMEQVVAATTAGLLSTMALLGGVGLLALIGLALVFGKLRRDSRELEGRIRDRTSLLRESNASLAKEKRGVSNLLDNMHQAIFAIDHTLTIISPVSEYATSVFGTGIEGRSIFDVLYHDLDENEVERARVETTLEVVFDQEPLQWELLEEHLPRRISLAEESSTGQQILRVSNNPIWNEAGLLTEILFVVEDITDLERLEREVVVQKEASARNLQMLQELMGLERSVIETFLLQSLSLLQTAKDCVGLLGRGADPLAELFRTIHTVKGNASVLNLTMVANTAHRLENTLGEARESLAQAAQPPLLGDKQIEACRAGVQALRAEIADYSRLAGRIFKIEDAFRGAVDRELRSEAAALETWSTELPLADSGSSRRQGLRRGEEIVARLLRLCETIAQPRLAVLCSDLQESVERRLADSLSDPEQDDDRHDDVELDQATSLLLTAIAQHTRSDTSSPAAHDEEKLPRMVPVIESRLLDLKRLCETDGQTDDTSISPTLQAAARRLMEVPIGSMVAKLRPMVVEVARTLHKEVNFVAVGASLSVCRHKLPLLEDAVTHLLRNAVGHGLEREEERLASGKGRCGLVELRFTREQGGGLTVVVADDGRGIDANRIQERAIQRGILDRAASERMTEPEKLRLVFHPGMSTSDEVTQLSGRGVGLDAVQDCANRMNATVQVLSEPGKWTRFIINLPGDSVTRA